MLPNSTAYNLKSVPFERAICQPNLKHQFEFTFLLTTSSSSRAIVCACWEIFCATKEMDTEIKAKAILQQIWHDFGAKAISGQN